MGIIIARGIVLHRAVVPEGNCAPGPLKPALIFRAAVLFKKLSDQRLAVCGGQRGAGCVVKERVLTKESAMQVKAGFLGFWVGSN